MALSNFLNRFFLYKKCAGLFHLLSVKINPKREMNRVYSATFHRNIDFQNPKNLIEKIYWLQLYSDTSLWTKCADKYLMREYVKSKGCEEYLPKLYSKWDFAKDIDITELPSKFILKTNNGCAQCYIVKDKEKVNVSLIRKTFKKWMSIPYGFSGAQLHYTRIKPCIIAEELLEQGEELDSLSPLSLVDFKVWCFNGKPESIWVAYNRKPGNVSMSLYDINWNPLPDKLVSTNSDTYHPEVHIPKPKCLEKMIDIAKTLSADFLEVRIDFYVIRNKPIVGEMTFSSGFGYFTEEYYNYLGGLIDLSMVSNN